MIVVTRKSGTCLLCGSKLTSDESVERGYGKRCYKKLKGMNCKFVKQMSLFERIEG